MNQIKTLFRISNQTKNEPKWDSKYGQNSSFNPWPRLPLANSELETVVTSQSQFWTLTNVFVKVIRSEASNVPHPKTWLTGQCLVLLSQSAVAAKTTHLPSETRCHHRPLCDIRHDGDHQELWMNIAAHSRPGVNQIIRSGHKWQPFYQHAKWLPVSQSGSYCISLDVTLLTNLG